MEYNTVVTTIDDKNHIVLTANDFALIIKKYAGEDAEKYLQEIFEHLEDIEDIENKLLTAENELETQSDEYDYLESRVEKLEQELSIEYCNNCTIKNNCPIDERDKSLSFERCFERIERE